MIFKEIFLFELKYRLKRPATYIYFLMLAFFAYLFTIAMGGAFQGVSVMLPGITGKVNINSPFVIYTMVSVLSYFGILVVSAVMANPVYRDFEHQVHSLFYTLPITKTSYLGGRFAGSFVITLFVFTGIAFGILLASWMPFLDEARIGHNTFQAYLQPYLLTVIPNILFAGAIFFALATLTRNILSTYIAAVAVLVLYGIAGSLIADIDNKTIAALLDPLGSQAVDEITRYWTVAEKNNFLIPFSGVLLANRLIWMAAGAGILFFTYKRFSFSYLSGTKKRSKKAKVITESKEDSTFKKLSLPKAVQQFTAGANWKQYLSLTKREFSEIVKNRYFIAIVFAGVALLFVNGMQIGKMYGTTTYPVTYRVIEFLGGSFSLFVLIIITFYSGELVWKERELKINQIIDSLPVSGWVPFTSKLSALMLVQVVLLLVVWLCGIIIQAGHGYFNFEMGLYAKALFGVKLIDYWLLCVLAMLVQVLVNQKFLGHFIMVAYYLIALFMSQFGFEHNLYQYNSDLGMPYSDMNLYGHFSVPFTWFKAYWAAFALILALAGHLLWVRGIDQSIKWRLYLAKTRFTKPALLVGGLALIVFLSSGTFIFYNTNILNEYKTSKEVKKERVEFEKKYKKFEKTIQPRIVSVKLNADIFPEKRKFAFKGHYWIKNKATRPIDSVILNINSEAKINKLAFKKPYRVALADEENGFYIYKLKNPLLPGDSAKLNIDISYHEKGFKNSGSNTSIVHNGTFIHSTYLPFLGYNEGAELSNDEDRKQYGLPPKERMAPATDTVALMNNPLSTDADWIDFEATVSTSADQIAIAPGYLQKEWTENGRRYFHYKMDAPILNFYSFLSAKYEVERDRWVSPEGKEVSIEVYYHKGHDYNIERMIKAVKKSLDYFTEQFSPYQHRQVRIMEFPRYQSFAQSFPNTIPYSESIGFIAKIDEDDPEDIDYPFYITAHEVAHQWFGHQVAGGNVQGSTFLVESLAQYGALMVMEEEFGEAKMRKFLKYEMDKYLRGRAMEQKKEMPLIKVENQQYIHYQKGSVVMYALKDYIGEERLNRVISGFLHDKGFQQPPYTHAGELLERIREATPDSLQYLIEDMFETITLYENKARAVEVEEKNGQYEVTLTIEAKKLRADSLGNETAVPLNDWIDIGVLDENDDPLYLKKHKIDRPEMTFTISVNKKPESAGIDPYYKLIDRNPDDNVKSIGEVFSEI